MTDHAASLVAALEAKKYPAPLAYDQSIWNGAINEAVDVVRAAGTAPARPSEPGVVLRADEAEQLALTLDVTVEALRAIEREVLTREATFRARRHDIQGATPAAAAVSEGAIGNAARNYVTRYSEADRPCGDGERLLTVVDREALIRLGVALGGAR